MKGKSNWQRLADTVRSLFVHEGQLDHDEIDFLMKTALENGEIDEKERNVLKGIFNQVQQDKVEPEIWQEIQDIRKKYNI